MSGAETGRLAEDAARVRNWKRWGPYLAERQWGTVREDYSEYGDCWTYFPHDHARGRAYRWGEDGLLSITDREGRLCLALALWNGRDPIFEATGASSVVFESMVGTVNANREYFETGVRDMAQAEAQYPGWLERLLTHPVRGLENWRALLDTLTQASGAIKVYCVVSDM